MNCEWTAQQLDAYDLGLLDDAERQQFHAHLAACERCRQLHADARAADQAVRQTLAWADPGPEFADRVLSGVRRPAWRRWRRVAAVAAVAVACLAVLHGIPRTGPPRIGPPPPEEPAVERVVVGELRDAAGQHVGRVEDGEAYVAATPAAIDEDRSLFLLPQGTTFAAAPGGNIAISVHDGAVLGQVRQSKEPVTIAISPGAEGAVVRTRDCQFYSLSVPANGGDRRAVAVHVFSGTLQLDVGGKNVALAQGDSIIVSGGGISRPTGDVVARIGRLRGTLGDDVLTQRSQLRRVPEEYARLVDRHPQLAKLDAAEAELDRLAWLSNTATEELGRLVTLASSVR